MIGTKQATQNLINVHVDICQFLLGFSWWTAMQHLACSTVRVKHICAPQTSTKALSLWRTLFQQFSRCLPAKVNTICPTVGCNYCCQLEPKSYPRKYQLSCDLLILFVHFLISSMKQTHPEVVERAEVKRIGSTIFNQFEILKDFSKSFSSKLKQKPSV